MTTDYDAPLFSSIHPMWYLTIKYGDEENSH